MQALIDSYLLFPLTLKYQYALIIYVLYYQYGTFT